MNDPNLPSILFLFLYLCICVAIGGDLGAVFGIFLLLLILGVLFE